MFESAKIKPPKKDSSLLGALAYLSGFFISFIGPLLIYLLSKEDKFARFHALQALIFQVAFSAIMLVSIVTAYAGMFVLVGFLCLPFIFVMAFAAFILQVYWAYLAYQGESFKIPYIGDMVLEHV